jgi:acetyl-CoA carboxylase biotin carboxyl carrier protein
MSEHEALPLLAHDAEDGRIELCAPVVGRWADPPPRGARLAAGDAAGVLLVLGRAIALRVPAGAAGTVVSDPPELRRAPVGYGERLLLLDPGDAAAVAAPARAAAESAGLLLRSAQSGRFWLRPAPGADPFVAEGGALAEGVTYGLLEVMKTFQPLKYRAAAGLPARAQLLRWLAADGAEVAEGQPLAALGE